MLSLATVGQTGARRVLTQSWVKFIKDGRCIFNLFNPKSWKPDTFCIYFNTVLLPATGALLLQLFIVTPLHRLQPIRTPRPTAMSLLGRGQRAAFWRIASQKMHMSLCCFWKPDQRTKGSEAHDSHGRSTCRLHWPTTSVMTSTPNTAKPDDLIRWTQLKCFIFILSQV